MGRISHDAAKTAAYKIVEPINKKIIEVNKEIREILTEYYRATVPPEVMKMWKNHSKWMNSLGVVYPKGIGISKTQSQSIDTLPGRGGYSKDLELSKEQALMYTKLCDKRDDLQEKYKNTQKEIEQTILALATHKRIAEEFPEVAGYIDGVKEKTQMIVQLAPVREKVRCLVSPEKDKKCMDKIIG